jgi:hypothetical protein
LISGGGLLVTIDVDWLRMPNGFLVSSEEQFARILYEMQKCEASDLEYRVSGSNNGFHIRCNCKGCEVCRIVFDSPVRWDMDQTRPPETREVLWDSKVYRKGENKITLKSGEWVEC